jgi:3'-phosphoadenosine 5'-phosphosulfate (PAPS) 3'-phosphatase
MESAFEDINLAEFMSVCIYLSEECGKIIRHVSESGDLKTIAKGVENPVTIADIRVQKTLEENLKILYPTLNVQGEESKESMEGIESIVKPDSITASVKKFVTSEFLNKKHHERRDFIEN